MNRATAVALVVLTTVVPRSAFAQHDLSGEWSARYHEDQEHRIPGPALGDYTGLPINDAARLKADSWEAVRGGAETTYPEYQLTLQRRMSSGGVSNARPTASSVAARRTAPPRPFLCRAIVVRGI